MKASLWGLMFIAVVMLSNPGVNVPLSHLPTMALVLGSLALVVSWFAPVRRLALAHSSVRPLRPSMTK